MQLLSLSEEKQIERILDKAAKIYKLYTQRRQEKLTDGMVIDRLWKIELGDYDKIPVIGFEIEKGIPSNERIRKDIMNIVYSKAPRGYIILPHGRIMNADPSNSSVNWYKNSFYGDFQSYCKLFPNTDIRLVDTDAILGNESAISNGQRYIPYLTEDDFRTT